MPIRGRTGQFILLLLWGLLLGLSFPRPNMWVLAHLALVPLTLLAIRGEPVGRVLLLSWVAGAVWWLVMLYWIVPVTVPGYFAMSLYLGLYPAAFVLGMRVIHLGLGRPPLTLTVPVMWVALEYVRGLLMTGFPWYLLGHSQPTTLIQIADVTGAYGVSFLVAMTSGLLCDLLTRPLMRPTAAGGMRRAMPVRLALPLWLVLLGGTIGYGVFRVNQDVGGGAGDASAADAGSTSLRVAVVQSNVPQSNKMERDDEQDRADFNALMELSRSAAEWEPQPDLIVWPETMVPRPVNAESVSLFDRLGLEYGTYRRRLVRFAEDQGVAMLIGAHAMTGWERGNEGGYRPGRRYNAAYLIDARGRVARRYDKLHRVPFGEYMPGVESWPWAERMLLKLTPYEESYALSPGERVRRFRVEPGGTTPGSGGRTAGADAGRDGSAWTFATPICFEDVVSYVPRRMVWGRDAAKRADLLVNISNDGWFAGTAEGPQHEQIARFRCVENRVPMARSVNTGISGFIDSNGRVVERVRGEGGRLQQAAGGAVTELHRDPRWTLFGRIGDAFAMAVLIAAVALILLVAAPKLLAGKRR